MPKHHHSKQSTDTSTGKCHTEKDRYRYPVSALDRAVFVNSEHDKCYNTHCRNEPKCPSVFHKHIPECKAPFAHRSELPRHEHRKFYHTHAHSEHSQHHIRLGGRPVTQRKCYYHARGTTGNGYDPQQNTERLMACSPASRSRHSIKDSS